MIIDYEEFQDLLQQRQEMRSNEWERLLGSLVNEENVDDEAVRDKWHNSYREIAAIVLLHRKYGSWKKLSEALTVKYPFSGLKEKLEKYSGLDRFKDSNMRKIGNRLSVNDLLIVMFWYEDWREDPNEKRPVIPMRCSNTVCALNNIISFTVKTALGMAEGLPLNVNTMQLDFVISMLECLAETEWDNQQFYYSNEQSVNLDKALLILEAMDAPLVEMDKGQVQSMVSVFQDCKPRVQLDEEPADCFKRLVSKQLEMMSSDGQLVLIMDSRWADDNDVHKLISKYMANGQIRAVFDIPLPGYGMGRSLHYNLTELRCIVFSVKSDNDKVQVIDFSDLLEGKDPKVLEDDKAIKQLQRVIGERFKGNGDNVAFADKEFFLEQSNAYNPYMSILCLEKMRQEGKFVSLEQLMGKDELPERLVKEGIAVPEMLSIFRPVAMNQLKQAKKRSTQDRYNESEEMVYTVGTKHLRDGALFVRDDELEAIALDTIKEIPDFMQKIQRYILQPGDLLISRIGGATIALVTEEDIGGRLLMAADSLHIIRCNEELVKDKKPLMNTRFIYMYLSSRAGKRQLKGLTKGGLAMQISLKELSNTILPADPEIIKTVTEKWYQIHDAKKIIDGCFAECDKLLRM